MKRQFLRGLATTILGLSIVGCFGGTEYEGNYALREGNDCSPSREASFNEVFLVITKLGAQDTFKARFPMAAAMTMPISSEESSPLENKLTFSFFKEGKSGIFTGQPAVEMIISVTPHPEKNDYLIITEMGNKVSHMGQNRNTDILTQMAIRNPYLLFDKGNVRGLCIKKKAST